MLSRRSSAGVAVLEGMLYVAGGNDGTSCLNSVERFNPKTNTWEGVAPMNIRRLAHGQIQFSLVLKLLLRPSNVGHPKS